MIWLFYILQILVTAAIVGIILIQKGSDGIFARDTKMFGIRGRSNTIIKITYILGAIFMINSIVLGIMYNKKYQEQLIKETVKTETIEENKTFAIKSETNTTQQPKTQAKRIISEKK